MSSSGSTVAATAATSAAASPPAQPPPPPPPRPPPPPPQPQPPPPLPGTSSGTATTAEPELVSLILNRLKSQGLFDQFRRDCLADVDTKPAYQNLRQRVDNFVSNHLATHTWSPHLNKNQLRNNIRQQVLKSGMLESGIDRIISQVVDPKINHIFRPQVEKAVHEFLATLNHKEEASPSMAPPEEKPDASVTMQGVSAAIPNASVANDAMSILETITSLNQEASAARASTEAINSRTNDRASKKILFQQSLDSGIERERNAEDLPDGEKPPWNTAEENSETVANSEDLNNLFSSSEEGKTLSKEVNSLANPNKEAVQESDEQKSKLMDRSDRKSESSERGERKKEKKEKKFDHLKRSDDILKARDEKAVKDRETESIKHAALEKNSKHKANESTKEALEDSDVDLLSDITVSSVHTSDLSSFEEESEEEIALSDSTEEGEIVSDDEEEEEIKTKPEAGEPNDKKPKPGRHAYVHKPYLYSKYYSDSDDERTVEQRRQSVAREKEERLLRRRLNREKLEEKRKQKAAEKTKALKIGKRGKSSQNVEMSSSRGLEPKAGGASIKDVLKEQRFFEKKVALSRKRKRESRHSEEGRKKKYEQSEEDLVEPQKTNESGEKSSSKEVKASQGKNEASKLVRRLSESVHSTDENRSDPRIEREHKRKTSLSLQVEGTHQDTEPRDPKFQFDRTEANPEEPQKQKNVLKNEKHIKKDDLDTQNFRTVPKKEGRSSKDKNERERTLSEEKSLTKHKSKGDSIHKTSDEAENVPSERGLKGEENIQKHSQLSKALSDDKAERKNKHRSERKASVNNKDVKNVSEHVSKNEDSARKENRKDRQASSEKSRAEHKSKRLSSDSRPPKESPSASKQHSSATSRRSESYSEDKHDAESTSLDNSLRQSDSIHKDKRRSKSVFEERSFLKSKSKSYPKQAKVPETELQESCSKLESEQKSDKDRNTEESDPDKQSKSKTESKVFDENSLELELESGTHVISSSQKDSSHRVKLQSVEKSTLKEKTKSDKDLNSSRLERKFSAEGHKNRSLKHSSKEMRKREEDNKPEDKGSKQIDGHAKMPENDLSMDKKSSKRLAGENRKGGSSIQEMDIGEEKAAATTSVSSPFPAFQKPVRISGRMSHSEQSPEPMETESEQRLSSTHHQISQAEEESNNNLRQETKLKNTVVDQTCHNSMYELDKSEHSKETSPEPSLSRIGNPEQKVGTVPTKEVGVPSDAFKQALKAVGPIEQEPYRVVTKYETSDRILLPVSHKDEKLKFQRMAEGSQTPKNLKHIIGPSEESSSPTNNSSREDADHKKHVDMHLAEVTDPLFDVSKGESLNRACIKDVISDSQTIHTVEMDPPTSIVLSSNIKDGKITGLDVINKSSSKVGINCNPAAERNISALTCVQEASMLGKGESASIVQNENLSGPVAFKAASANATVLTSVEKDERDHVKESSFVEQSQGAIECKDQIKENHGTGAIIESSSGSVPELVPEEISKASARASEGGGSGGASGVIEDKNESSVVGSSIGGSKRVDIHNRTEVADTVIIGTSTERSTGSTITATSTGEGLGKEGASSHLQREGDAIITCSEEKSGSVLSCTSIEADEGFTVGTWANDKEGPHFTVGKGFGECSVTAAEASGSVTEGLAACESSLTSTKEGESGECAVNYVEQSSKPLVNDSGVELEQRINSVAAEEKDDAVTSAGSEERCMASTCDGTSNFGSTATCTGETDSDGAVTSAGTDAQDGPTNANVDEFQSHATGTEQLKAAEGAVTCTGAERGDVGFAICSVTGTDLQEESAVTGACAEMVTDNMATGGPRADKSEDVVNGESAVTSTGITAEDDPEVAAACTGLEDSNEGFAVSLVVQGKYEHTTDSTEARAETNVTEVSRGSCDDEGFVTSTGAKEDDEEGENFVTSTGRGNEETEHPLACTGTEESGRALLCEGAAESGSSSVCLAAGHLGAELGVVATNVDKGTVDSMTGLEKATKHAVHNSSKGVVESSTTSVGTGSENVMVFVAGKEEESTTAEKSECGMISATSQQSIGQLSSVTEKNEDASYLDSRKCEDLLYRTVSKEVAMPSANEDDKGETISTSVVKLTSAHCSDKDIGQTLPLVRTVENFEKTTSAVGAEDFEAPMPSTAVEYTSQDGAADVKPNKVSTSILEEFEAPMPSAAMEDNESLFATVRAVEMTSTSLEMYAAPMPSASTGGPDESHAAVCSKEERDECTVISTSILEEPGAPISQVGTGDPVSHFALRSEQAADAAVISTSTTEHFEASVSPAVTQEVNQVSVARMEGSFETFAISTSTAEGCTRASLGVLVPVDNQQTDEGAMVCTNATEECKAVLSREATNQEFRLVVQSTEETNQSSTAVAGKEEKREALGLALVSSKPDEQLVALSTDNPEATTSARTVEECDSVSAIVVSEGVPPTFASVEIENVERSTAQCAKALDCTISSAPQESSSSVELHRESLHTHQEEPESALEEKSALSKTVDETESTEMPTHTVKSVSVGENLSTEIRLGSSVSEGSLPETCMHVNRAEEGGLRNEVASRPSDIPLEQERGDENLTIDHVNHTPVFKTDTSETRVLSNQNSSTSSFVCELGSSFQDRALAEGTDQCRLVDTDAEVDDRHEPKASSQRSAAHDSDNKEIVPVVTEELELMTKGATEEDLKCPAKENPCEERPPEEILKVLEASDTSVIMEAIEVKVPEEKSLEVIEIPSQEEEGFMPETTDRHPAIGKSKSDDSLVNLTLREEVEESQRSEARPETNTGATGTDSEKIPEGVANAWERSSDAAEGKGDIVGKVDICEKPDLKSGLNPVEVIQQVPVKRKRGRPRKYPVETAALQGQDLEADTSTGNKTSGPHSRAKTTPKVKDPLNENKKGNETEEGKKEVVIRRRGRKPKRPLMPSEEAGMDAPEPAKKRQKLAPAVEEETQGRDEGKAGGNNGDNVGNDGDSADETRSGATTRAASRLEAQRKQPSKPTTRATSKNQSPGPVSLKKCRKLAGKKPISAQSNKSPLLTHSKLQPGKRKREASPSVVHKKGHLRGEEPEMKKTKR